MAAKKTKGAAPKNRVRAARARAAKELEKQKALEEQAVARERAAVARSMPPPPEPVVDPDSAQFQIDLQHEKMENFTLQSVARDLPKNQIARLLMKEYGLGLSASLSLIRRTEEGLAARVKGISRDTLSAKAQIRVGGHLRKAEEAGDIPAMLRAEEVLMDLQGTKAPEEIIVRHTSLEVYIAVFSQLEDAEVVELVEEGVRAERLALAAAERTEREERRDAIVTTGKVH